MSTATSKPLRVLRIVEGTSVDGPGLRTAIYFAGCRHACPGCHNPQSWDFAAGDECTVDELVEAITKARFDVTFTGGDPMYLAADLLPLADAIHALGHTLWCYTGFTYEEVMADPTMRSLAERVDVLVDGPYEADKRQLHLLFRGSANQRLIDMAASLREGRPVLFEPDVKVL